MLKTYKIYNPTVRFSKYKFNNKFMGSITLLMACLDGGGKEGEWRRVE